VLAWRFSAWWPEGGANPDGKNAYPAANLRFAAWAFLPVAAPAAFFCGLLDFVALILSLDPRSERRRIGNYLRRRHGPLHQLQALPYVGRGSLAQSRVVKSPFSLAAFAIWRMDARTMSCSMGVKQFARARDT